ncbi:MAG: acetylornithine carbamoyltransferase [Chromatiales bacterium]|jgi:N-acetylornithine carbamoyltransferase|nr:acetylornithine carbamoyltransferase [Chromatiales bacterium]MDP6150516.1 N-acetylornithine carbamoyltransferase [Gammaproteobacteria bacterium]MDP7092887.1 N-acetylornithine carbamoyltransferase [Gammaproteobacteria bacterium]MDP7270261.1 N-acetylornithine carbamoyltransferase [Gammaproteobacteria bacterium]HJP05197.1 N-acetylornithine carbamoyltransferase [Gammaproteobacteria bacterium]
MKDFHDLADFQADEINALLELAGRLESSPEPHALAGKVLALLFLSPSLRTLASFQAAMTRLGGGSFVISPNMSIHGLETRPGIVMDGMAAEHIREAVPVIASYADAIGIRAFAERESLEADLTDKEFNSMRELCEIPRINMESAINHPCQSLADWKTMDDLGVPRSGGKFVLSWAYHPRALPLAVPAATVHMAAMRGMDVSVLRPEGFELPDAIMQKAAAAAEKSGGSVVETSDHDAALEGANIIYAKSWSSTKHYGNRPADEEFRRGLDDWCVDEPWFEKAHDDCRFMHCLPVRRGVVVADRILDGPRSIVIQEARNRMYAQMAVLHQMLVNS